MVYHGFFILLYWIEATLSKTYEKKRSVMLILYLENVGNFQLDARIA